MNRTKKYWKSPFPHQYVCRKTGRVINETLVGDLAVLGLYSTAREKANWLFKILTSRRASQVLGFCNYGLPFLESSRAIQALAKKSGTNMDECVDSLNHFTNARKFFERKIRYWQTRPMPEGAGAVVSPADARVIVGSLEEIRSLYLKEALFGFEELLGENKSQWLNAFSQGDFAVFRLTPDKYHYNHTPVAGVVQDIYEIHGAYHSCNPGAVIVEGTPYSKNKRVVTIIDTDVPGGTQAGLVAMVEVAAMMIGDIVQCYSALEYESPQEVRHGMFLVKGQPKSLYRPGSSTDVLLFEKGRMRFSEDLVRNTRRTDVQSRFSQGFGRAMVETEVQARQGIGWAC